MKELFKKSTMIIVYFNYTEVVMIYLRNELQKSFLIYVVVRYTLLLYWLELHNETKRGESRPKHLYYVPTDFLTKKN